MAESGFGIIPGLKGVIVFEEAGCFFTIVVGHLDVDAAMVLGAEGVGTEIRTPTGIVPVGDRLCGYLAGFFTAEEDHFEEVCGGDMEEMRLRGRKGRGGEGR